ncbi:DNA repair exonuclease [bacterium]|nr:DNA repair exonuclease [bacterium]
MAIRLLHLSDLHLGYSNPNLRLESADFTKAFGEAVRYALEPSNDVQIILICGDLFHTYAPPPDLAGFARTHLKSLTDSGRLVVLIPGTHDGFGYPGCVYKRESLPGIHIITQPAFTEPLRIDHQDQQLFFYGMAYDSVRTRNPFAGLKRCSAEGIHIALLHGSIEGNPEWKIRKQDLPISLERLKDSGMDYVAMGHYHNFAEYDANGVKVVYPGTLQGMKFGENGPRYMAVVDFHGSRPQVQKIPVKARIIGEANLDLQQYPFESEDQLVDHIQNKHMNTQILRIRLKGVAGQLFDLDKIAGSLRALFSYIEIIDESQIYDSSFLDSLKEERTIRGNFVREMLRRFQVAPSDKTRALIQEALKLTLIKFQNKQE